ncbi:MAG: hypothetical protein WC667_04910 [Sulfurimonas sp.]|jgi:hypothetical protein
MRESIKTLSILLIILLLTACGNHPNPMISKKVNLNGINEGVVYYLPKNSYEVTLDFTIQSCDLDSPDLFEIETKIDIKTMADQEAAFVANPKEFDNNKSIDNFSTAFTRSKEGFIISVNTTNSNKTAEVITNYVKTVVTVAGTFYGVPVPAVKLAPTDEPKCRREISDSLSDYKETKENITKENSNISAFLEEIDTIRASSVNKLPIPTEVTSKIIELNKKIKLSTKSISELTKELAKLKDKISFKENFWLYTDDTNSGHQLTHTIDAKNLEKLFDNAFEISNKNIQVEFINLTGTPIKQDNNLSIGTYNGIVYRDNFLAKLNISFDNKNLYSNIVPFRQAALIGVAPIYNWGGDGNSSVTFYDDASLKDYSMNLSKTSAEKYSEASKGIATELEGVRKKQLEYDKDLAALQKEKETLTLQKDIESLKKDIGALK